MNVRGKRKTGRRFLAAALSVCMLLTAQPNLWDGVMAQAAEKAADNGDVMTVNAGHEGHAGWTAITENDENAVEWTGGQYYLGKDVTMGTITVTGEVTLCLNGHTLTHAGDTGSAVMVESGGQLTLCDCKDNWKCESSFDEDAKTYSCSLTGSGGRITGGKGTYIKESSNREVNLGGGVYVKPNATFHMNSGRITGCDIGMDDEAWFSRDGGGVYVADGTFYMTGGFIDGNRGELGGGVCLEGQASFTMSGKAVIMDNEGDVCGGVYCFGNDDIVFNMESGKILGNKGSSGGSGVFVGSKTLFHMSGGVIEGNTTTATASPWAAGLYCVSSEAKLSGGSIRYNISSGDAAGGVRVNNGTIQVTDQIRISDNYCNETLSNISLNTGVNAFITVTGELKNDIGVICKPVRGDVSYPATVVKGTDSYSVTEADRQHFSSDIEGYEVMRRETETGNELYLDVPPHVHDGNTYTALTADNTSLSGGTYYLSKDLEMETITTTGDVTLCLNGHTLTHEGDTGSVIVVESGTFTLCDCSGDNRGCITGGKVADDYGGGIYVHKDARLIMMGGTISGNEAEYGAGISIGGSGESGQAYFMMKGGIIENNTAQYLGGGIWGGAYSEITISNGLIRNNSAAMYGGGIYVGTHATVILSTDGEPASSEVLITGNTAGSGGGYFGIGTVNVAQTLKIFGNVSITENKADNAHNNIFLQKDKFFKLIGELTKPVGITLQKAPTMAAPIKIAEGADGYAITDDDQNCISSDNENYEILKKTTDTGNELYLAVPFAISANGAEISPEFDVFTTEYTASVANDVDTVGITATVGAVAADTTTLTMQVNGGAKSTMISGQEQQAADLKIGENTIKIAVTDAAGVSQTYTLVITRADKQVSPVTVTAHKDGAEWTDCPHTYKLISDDGSTTVTDLTAVPDGTYKIYSGDTDTGVKVTVEGKATDATVEYYTVTFKDGNQEMETPAQQIVLKGAAASVPADAPTKTGYTFSKWVTTDGGSAAYDFTKAVTGTTSVYASWTPKTCQVTFHYHGADGGDTTRSQNVTYDSKYGTLPVPSKAGYTFKGWYTEENGQGSKVDADTTVTTTSAHTLHAYWLDETAPDKPVLQDGVTLPTGWTNTQTTIPLKLYDGVGVTALLVSVDGSPYAEVSGFSGGTGSINYDYAVRSGKHTYQFKAVDAVGNTSAESDPFAVRLDQEPPVIGTLTYENEVHLNLWHWIIGKKNMMIHVPVTDTGSGVAEISYTLTPGDAAGNPDSSKAVTRTATVTNGEAEITFETAFRGSIAISCTDGAGNAADSVTVGKEGGGIIIEDNAPQIAFQAENAELLQTTGEYKSPPDITVTVTDNKDNAVSAGIAIVSYKIGNNGSVKMVNHDYTTGIMPSDSFTIPADEILASGIPADGVVISVTATDNAGNSITATHTVKVHTHSAGQSVPEKEATCTEKGNIAYYTCSCGSWFSDSACTEEITDISKIELAALGHHFTMQHDQNEHWQKCSRCPEEQSREAHTYDNDSDRDCNICGYERPIGEAGTVSKDVQKDEKAPDTTLSTSKEELADIILTEEEKAQVENGTDIKFLLNVKDAGDTVSSSDKMAVQQALDGDTEAGGFAVGQYLDISLFKIIGDTRSAIFRTARKLTIVINVPDSLKSKDSAKPRTYAIIRVHDGVAETLADKDDNADTITIDTDRFSAYALVYKEAGGGTDVTPSPTPGGSDKPSPTPDGGSKPAPTPGGKDKVTPAPSPSETPEKASGKEKRKIELHSGLKAVQTGKKLQISWGRVTGADGYSVYVQYCGKNFSAKSLNQVRSGKQTKITIKKINGKKLDTTKKFKLYVVAWQIKNGKKCTLAKTLGVHIAGKDSAEYTNVKSIRLKKISYTLKKGGAVTLRPKAVLYDRYKKQLSAAHTKEFRYLSSNQKIATVTAGGKVKAKGVGSCTIYVFAKNGCKRKIKIKIKK